MATQAFEYALEDADLVSKAVNTLRSLNSSTVVRQNTIRDLQILEAVLRGVQEGALASASEDTLRNLQYCSQFCRPPLSRFLRSLKELEPDLCHAPICEESLVETNEAPAWTTKLESEVAALQGSVGKGLRVIDLLLRVEGMQCDLAANTALPEDLQRTSDNLQKLLRNPGERHFGPGHYYHNIQTNGGYSHYGDKYCFNGTLPSALIEALSSKLDGTAGMLHIDHSMSIGEDLSAMLPHGFPFTHVVNDNASKPPTTTAMEVQPLTSQSTQQSATELTKLLLQCLLDLLRTKLNAILAMLLWAIPNFRVFIRSLRTFARQPSMLLDSNITLIDPLDREISLPYEWFRDWPHMLAHLQYEFKGMLDGIPSTEIRFFHSQDSLLPQRGQIISLDHWEDLVRPGSRVAVGLRLGINRAHRLNRPCHIRRVEAHCAISRVSNASTSTDRLVWEHSISRSFSLGAYQPGHKDIPQSSHVEDEDVRYHIWSSHKCHVYSRKQITTAPLLLESLRPTHQGRRSL